MDVEQQGIAFGKEGDRYVVGGGEAAEAGRREHGAGAFDAGGHGEELEGGVGLGGSAGEVQGIEDGEFGGLTGLVDAGDDEFGVAIEIEVKQGEGGEVAAVPVLAEDVAVDVQYEELAGIPEVVMGDGNDARDAIGKATEDIKTAGEEGWFEGFDGGLDGAAEAAGPEHVAAGVEAVEEVVGIGQFAGDEEFVGAVGIEIGLDDFGEKSTGAGGGVGAGVEGPGGAALFVEGGDDAVIDGEVMEGGGAEIQPGGDGAGEEREQSDGGVDEVGRPRRGRGLGGAPGVEFGRQGDDAAVGAGEAANGEGASAFPELDGANGDAEVAGEFLPGLEFGGHGSRMGWLGTVAKRNEAKLRVKGAR